MENGNENNDKHKVSPLLLVPMDEAKSAKTSRGGKRFVALVLVSATAAAAAMMGLMNYSLSTGVVHPIASAFSSVSTGRKKGESCVSPWWNACGDKLSCYDNGSRRYCVPMGENMRAVVGTVIGMIRKQWVLIVSRVWCVGILATSMCPLYLRVKRRVGTLLFLIRKVMPKKKVVTSILENEQTP